MQIIHRIKVPTPEWLDVILRDPFIPFREERRIQLSVAAWKGRVTRRRKLAMLHERQGLMKDAQIQRSLERYGREK